MKKSLLIYFGVFVSIFASAQNFKGQWKGEFIDKSDISWGSDKCDYVLELESKGSAVSGYSYTYFTDGGKKYYTICKLEGFIDRKKKYIEVKETERTKTNVPHTIRNCFQTHKLTYVKQGDMEMLEGNWIPAPKQDGDCGFGYTSLTRRILKSDVGNNISASFSRTAPVKKRPPYNTALLQAKDHPIAKANITKKKPDLASVEKDQDAIVKKDQEVVLLPHAMNAMSERNITAPEFKKRNMNVLKRIEVGSDQIRVDLYDNGEIDGDSVSLFYNGKLLASKKRLTDKALTFKLDVDQEVDINELVMYAENLGSIPPNTALMVVTDGIRRYEVRITSDLQKSGVIHFVHESRGTADNK